MNKSGYLKLDFEAPGKDLVIAENQNSIWRRVSGVSEGLGGLLLAVYEIVRSRCSTLEQALIVMGRESAAIHEVGHLLLTMLGSGENDMPRQAWVSQFSNETNRLLGLPLGLVGGGNESVLTRLKILVNLKALFGCRDEEKENDFDQMEEVAVVEEILMSMAGYAAEYIHTGVIDSSAFDVDNDSQSVAIDLSTEGDGGDFYDLNLAFARSEKYSGRSEELTEFLFNELLEFLRDPLAAKILHTMAEYLNEVGNIRDGGKDISPIVFKMLEERGVSVDDFNQLKIRYGELVAGAVDKLRNVV